MFLHVSVILFTGEGGGISACIAAGLRGGWYPSMPCRFPGPHPGGGEVEGDLGGGVVSRPTSKREVEGDLAREGYS